MSWCGRKAGLNVRLLGQGRHEAATHLCSSRLLEFSWIVYRPPNTPSPADHPSHLPPSPISFPVTTTLFSPPSLTPPSPTSILPFRPLHSIALLAMMPQHFLTSFTNSCPPHRHAFLTFPCTSPSFLPIPFPSWLVAWRK